MKDGYLLRLEDGKDVEALSTGQDVQEPFKDACAVEELTASWRNFPLASLPENAKELFLACKDLLIDVIREVAYSNASYELQRQVMTMKTIIGRESADYVKLLQLLSLTDEVLVHENLIDYPLLITEEESFALLPLKKKIDELAQKAMERLSHTNDYQWLSPHIEVIKNMTERGEMSQLPTKIAFILSSMKTSTAELIESLADMLDKWPDKNAVASPLGKIDSIYFSANQPAAIGTMYFTSAHEILKQIGGIARQLEVKRRLFGKISPHQQEDLKKKITFQYMELSLLLEAGTILEKLKYILGTQTEEA